MPESDRSTIFSLLFPTSPRDFPHRRLVMMLFRVVHIITVGVLLGGFVFNQSEEVLNPWLWGVIASGMAILVIDLHASCAILFEGRGLAVATKIALLMSISVFWDQRILIMIVIMTIGVLSSHMSRKYRHRIFLFGDRIVPDERRG